VPTRVEAGFLSSLFGAGDQVYAETSSSTPNPSLLGNNLQNIALLQANVSSISVLEDKNNKEGKTSDSSDPLDTNIVSENALLSATGPMGVSDGTNTANSSLEDTSVYVVRKGDTVSLIAKIFGVSVNTILMANDLKKGDKLTEGDVLLILPISGVEHTVAKGQTLQSIARQYKVDISDITQFNGIAEDEKLAIGDKIMIPGGEMYDEGGDKPASNLASSVVKDKNYYATHPIQNLIGYFVNPLPTGHKTQGLHGPGYRGIDIGAPTGTPLYASASGVALIVKTGCKVGRSSCGGGYGNMTIIQHPNGTKTLYAHMSKVSISTGTKVSQGQIIGYVGSTGHSTGPHVHFEVFGAKNPGSDWSWAN
jgi:murein DD-endopeptidase MepM/ murein hydrolase activator NlpD